MNTESQRGLGQRDGNHELSSKELERRAQDGLETVEEPRVEDLKWSGVRGEEASPDWSPSPLGPSSEEEEEEGEEERTASGYTLLPQDAEPINGYEMGEGEAVSLEQDSPRITKWLQKQLKDMTSVTSSSKTEDSGTGWAMFSDPAPCGGSEDWPNVTVKERTPGVATTTGPVEPVSTMEEAEAASIREAMAGFSLPISATPSWAQAVPESVWKSELIGGLQKHPKKK